MGANDIDEVRVVNEHSEVLQRYTEEEFRVMASALSQKIDGNEFLDDDTAHADLLDRMHELL